MILNGFGANFQNNFAYNSIGINNIDNDALFKFIIQLVINFNNYKVIGLLNNMKYFLELLRVINCYCGTNHVSNVEGVVSLDHIILFLSIPYHLRYFLLIDISWYFLSNSPYIWFQTCVDWDVSFGFENNLNVGDEIIAVQ